LLELGFSFVYDKALYDAMRGANPSAVHGILDYQDHLARFLENHDEERCAVVFPNERLIAAGTLMGTLPGMRFYHQGELDGRIGHELELGRLLIQRAIQGLLRKVLRITNEYFTPVWSLLPVAAEATILPEIWRSTNGICESVENHRCKYRGAASQGRVRMDEASRRQPSMILRRAARRPLLASWQGCAPSVCLFAARRSARTCSHHAVDAKACRVPALPIA
jgi:hypothetical protein